MSTPIDESARAIARAVEKAGGRAVIVGGLVRDHLLELPSKDYDFEVYGLSLDTLEAVLGEFGEVVAVGRSFGVLRIKGFDMDLSLPRRDNKTGRGHRGFVVDLDPELSFEDASLRRDLTVNSMGMDALTGEILDPHGGREDLKAGTLRATSSIYFPEDPLRGLRVMQFAARFNMQPDEELLNLCKQLDLSELPAERLFQEFNKLLLKGQLPSIGLKFLRESDLLHFFPEVEALIGVPQNPKWHPEGDVWIHTLMSLDAAAKLRVGDATQDQALMFATLCHDFGKPECTREEKGVIRSTGHETAGDKPTRAFLERLKTGNELTEMVVALVHHHLAPGTFVNQGAGDSAYRRLARKLEASKVSMELLERTSRADYLGRTTDDARRNQFPAGDRFLERARALEVNTSAEPDVVLGRHLIARGLAPGREFGEILQRCRQIQDETGWSDTETILQRALSEPTDS